VGNFVYLSVGTGVGAGLVLRGSLHRGAGGGAGEIGYLPIGHQDGPPASRRWGAFEEATAAAGVVRAAKGVGMKGPLTAERVLLVSALGEDGVLQGAVATALEAARDRVFARPGRLLQEAAG